MNVRHLLLHREKGCFSIDPNRPLREAVRLMMEQRIGSLLVLTGETLQGIVTERDILRAVDENGAAIATLRVADVMSRELVVCHPDEGVDAAMERMMHNVSGRRVRHLPVVEDGRLEGIISIGDVVQALLTETRFENRLLKNYIKNWPEPAA